MRQVSTHAESNLLLIKATSNYWLHVENVEGNFKCLKENFGGVLRPNHFTCPLWGPVQASRFTFHFSIEAIAIASTTAIIESFAMPFCRIECVLNDVIITASGVFWLAANIGGRSVLKYYFKKTFPRNQMRKAYLRFVALWLVHGELLTCDYRICRHSRTIFCRQSYFYFRSIR